MNTAIRTLSGKLFDYKAPYPKSFTIKDIATGLANLCRFGGQIIDFYSVAEHSVNCLNYAEHLGLSLDVQRSVLLHDAAEAFCCDIPRPLKQMLPEYQKIIERVESMIAEKYGLVSDPMVSVIDDAVLVAEKWELHADDLGLPKYREIEGVEIECVEPIKARRMFLDAVQRLGIEDE